MNIKSKLFLLISILATGIIIITGCTNQKNTQNHINTVTVEDVKSHITKYTEKTLEDFEGLYLNKIEAKEDKLLVGEDGSDKNLNNIIVEIFIDIDEDMKHSEKRDLTDLFTEKLTNNFSIPEAKDLKLARLRFLNIIYDNDYNNILNREIEYASPLDPLENTGDKDLVELDKALYQIFDEEIDILNDKESKHPTESEITRIGLDDSQIYLEAKIFAYNGDHDEYEDKLKQINENIIESIRNNANIQNIIDEHNIKDIKIIYNGKWYKLGDPLIFEYEL